MNTNPVAKRILCYGDSNTNGRIPGPDSKRFPIDIRWTGLLQSKLGDGYEVIEEGLGGRTTVVVDNDNPGRCGLEYLVPCIETHTPIDVFIMCLGTNDLKEKYGLSAQQVAINYETILQAGISKFREKQGWVPRIIVMAPPPVDESVPLTQQRYKGAEAKAKLLGDLYRQIAQKYEARFLDLAKLVPASKGDGYHLDSESHKKIAEELYLILNALTGL